MSLCRWLADYGDLVPSWARAAFLDHSRGVRHGRRFAVPALSSSLSARRTALVKSLVVPQPLNRWAVVPMFSTEDLARFGLVLTLAVTAFNLRLAWHWARVLMVDDPSVPGPKCTRVFSYGYIAAKLAEFFPKGM